MTDTHQIARLRRAMEMAQRPARGGATGPRTAEGKARSAMNATRHGLAAQVMRDPVEEERFKARLASLVADLEPVGETETALVERIAMALHRLERAERLEAEVFEGADQRGTSEGALLLKSPKALRTLDVVVRYGGAADAQLWRSLRALEIRQTARRRLRTVELPGVSSP
jgi:hypothetical protein